jgi:hypothetical protein
MGVDGINGPGGGAPPTGPSDVAGAASQGAEPARFDRALDPTSSSAPTDLERVASGELSVDDYLDARVHAATAHLNGVLNEDQLSQVREELRDRLSTDPLLARLVQRALGVSPSEPNR